MRRTTDPRFLLILLCCAALFQPVHAQRMKQRMAERYAEDLDYPRMARVYEDIVASGHGSIDDMRKLAYAYQKMDRPQDAALTYARLLAEGTPSVQDMRAYADLQRSLGNYGQATEWYGRVLAAVPDDAAAKEYLQGPSFFERLADPNGPNKVRNLNINSDKADIAPAIMDDLLVFSSARGEGVGGKTTYKWDGEPFLNLYTALRNGGQASDAQVLRKEINSRYHDGTATYDARRKELYFTRDNYVGGTMYRSRDGELKLGIYSSKVGPGEFGQASWGPLEPFAHNNPEISNGHPHITASGEHLWFVSDRPGGHGGTDIWYCARLGDEWGTPVNAGPTINTRGNEMYPFLSRDSVLYFTSNGHPGLGGHDIFMVRLTPQGPATVHNVGAPINTRSNDAGLVLLADDSTGFFFSDRPGGKGSEDIYGCTVLPPLVRIVGLVVEKGTGTPLDDAALDLRDGDGRIMDGAEMRLLPGGRFEMDVPYRQAYVIAAALNGYRRTTVDLAQRDDLGNVLIELEKFEYGVDGVVAHGETTLPLAHARVQLRDPDGQLLEETVSDGEGRYGFALKSGRNYRISAEKDGFFRQSARLTTVGRAEGAVLRTDFRLFPLEVDQVVRLDNIYYDLAKWNIRPDAAVELDKLVETLLDNPTVTIELSSHTDCRGKDAYNLSLSEKRAKSAVEYVIKKGVAKERVLFKGYGETKPVETCVCEQCSDDQHQRNRRTEFKVLSK